MRKCMTIVTAAAAVLACVAGAQADVVIDTVAVGNPGNAYDTHGDGYGGVDYVYNISKFETTAGQYTEFLNAVAADDTYGLYNESMSDPSGYVWGCNIQRTGSPGSYTYNVAGDWANRPVNYVSWGDAARFSNWLQNGQPTGAQGPSTTEDGSYFLNGAMSDLELMAVVREDDATWAIPTEDEWYKAAYHKNDGVTGNYFDYPTSNDSVPSNDLVDPDPGNNATFYDNDYTIGAPYYRTEVGAHENSDSPYGTFDQAGNVWVWNEAVIGSTRGMRGGSFNTIVGNLHAATRGNGYPRSEGSYLGFRVAEVPEDEFCFGDLDGDNDVDLADLAQLLAHYGMTSGAAYEDGDLDGDGDVDLADLAALLAVYGTICE